MRTIWKYPFRVTDDVTLDDVPEGARILPHVSAVRPTELVVWAEVDTDAPLTRRHLLVVGTGNPMPKVGAYVGTTMAGPFVWHVYEAP